MGNRGVLLYVDLGKLEDEPYRLSKIYDTLGQYIDDIRRQRDIIYISKMAESLDISSLDRYRAQLVDEYDRLGTLKKILDEAYDLYKECNEKFEASGQTLCNLYAETPWYETSEGKLAIGIGVLVVTAAVAIVCPAVLGATAAAVTQSVATSAIIGAATSGVMNGIASMNSGKSFYDGFASGFESGAILGAISGGLGAGTSAIMSGAELTVGRVMAVKAMNMVSDATVDSVVYAYHSNKYDKDFTGGDIVKTWVKSAATSFAMQSVGSGKSSSKTDGGNGVISNGKGRGEVEGSVNCETSYGKSSGKIGDFTELEGSNVDEILDRIPDEAVLRELYPVQGGATEGFEFKWVQNGQTYRVRVHNVDPSAPAGSNAYNGWVVRVQRGRRYFDPTINDFREAKYFNPNGQDYDEVIINDTHIPILDPYQN